MSILRVSEVYASVQGEGPRTGQTTVFVRFGGCNLRCPGWPCDTQHAIDPKYRFEWERLSAEELLLKTVQVAGMAGARMITLTGGEPFLQQHEELFAFVDGLKMMGYTIEAFTNGTILYPDWARENVNMIMDWKLPGSGENPLDEKRLENLRALAGSRLEHAVKFVIKDEDDFLAAMALYDAYAADLHHQLVFYYGKVWKGHITDARLAELVMRNMLPWRMNVQLHNYIWDPQERGR
jgi:7-carboxy-7-deazaguanine synthase